MTIRLPEHIERSITAVVRSGHFSSVDEAVTAAWLAFAPELRSPTTSQPLTPNDIHQQMLAEGLLTRLPDTAHDSDNDDEPVIIEGEPLSATIIHDRC